jgi:hypothetical protein
MSEAAHRVVIEFDGGYMTVRLICPASCPTGTAGECPLRTWFDNVAPEEILQGKVEVPVRVEWVGEEEGPLVHIAEAVKAHA